MSTKSSSTSSFSNSGKTLLKFKSEERLTEYETPHPEWKLGDGAVNETPEFSAPWDEHKKISFDPYGAGRNPINNYLLTVTALAPKPIGLMATVSKSGNHNLAPYSYFGVVGYDPLMLVVGTTKSTGKYKNTARNLLETGEATVNIISEWFVEAANASSTNAPEEVSEWPLAGLTQVPSELVKAPHVLESAVSFETRVHTAIPIQSRADPTRESGDVFLLEVVRVHARADLVDNKEDPGAIDLVGLRPVTRVGTMQYGRLTEILTLPKITYASPQFEALKGERFQKNFLEQL